MLDGMVFCPVVPQISGGRAPVKTELALCVVAAQPMVAHIHRLCRFGGDDVGEYAVDCGVVDLHWCAGLRMAHSSRVFLITTANFALMNRAPSSASAAEDMTAFIILEILMSAPLFTGTGTSAAMK